MTTKPRPRTKSIESGHPRFTSPGPNAGPDNYEGLPDAMFQRPHFTRTAEIVSTRYFYQHSTLVDGDTPVYYRDAEDKQRFFKPDCYVVHDVDQVAIRRRNGYYIDEVGKPPDFALEIASVSTAGNDLGFKRNLYAKLGIREYWRFDPTPGSEHYGEKLVGEVLVDRAYHRLELHETTDGSVWGHSEVLGMDLYWDYGIVDKGSWEDGVLRFYDPVKDQFLVSLLESEIERIALQATLGIETYRTEEQIEQAIALTMLRTEREVRLRVERELQSERAALQSERAARESERAALQSERAALQSERAARESERTAAEARERQLLEELRRISQRQQQPPQE